MVTTVAVSGSSILLMRLSARECTAHLESAYATKFSQGSFSTFEALVSNKNPSGDKNLAARCAAVKFL
jgi:hypothetical protein